MRTKILNAINDLYSYGPAKALRLGAYLDLYYYPQENKKVSFETLLDETSRICEELIQDNNRFAGFCQSLLDDISSYKGGK